MQIIETTQDLKTVDLSAVRSRAKAAGVLMCTPESFAVVDVKNYFMTGQEGKADPELAQVQWHNLHDTYARLGVHIEEIQAQPGIEDMVFSANSALTWQEPGGHPSCVMSRMFHDSRKRETPFYKQWFADHGYEVLELPDKEEYFFEGGGDGIWHPGKMLLWGGYGHRTTANSYEWISEQLNIPVILLELVSDEFYHLDTAFHPIDEQTVLYCPEAFNSNGQQLIEAVYPRRIKISKEQGKNFFTGNCFSINGKYIVMQQGDAETVKQCKEFGYETVEVDLGEYIKSGGNATCLKLDLYS